MRNDSTLQLVLRMRGQSKDAARPLNSGTWHPTPLLPPPLSGERDNYKISNNYRNTKGIVEKEVDTLTERMEPNPPPPTIVYDDSEKVIEDIDAYNNNNATKTFGYVTLGHGEGQLLCVGVRGPQGSIFEGGVVLVVCHPGSITYRVATPMHHPFIFCPIGKLLTTAIDSTSESAEFCTVPPWGAVFRHPFSPIASYGDLIMANQEGDEEGEQKTLKQNFKSNLFRELLGMYKLLGEEDYWNANRLRDRVYSHVPDWIKAWANPTGKITTTQQPQYIKQNNYKGQDRKDT